LEERSGGGRQKGREERKERRKKKERKDDLSILKLSFSPFFVPIDADTKQIF
jgi:hypothetical protein